MKLLKNDYSPSRLSPVLQEQVATKRNTLGQPLTLDKPYHSTFGLQRQKPYTTSRQLHSLQAPRLLGLSLHRGQQLLLAISCRHLVIDLTGLQHAAFPLTSVVPSFTITTTDQQEAQHSQPTAFLGVRDPCAEYRMALSHKAIIQEPRSLPHHSLMSGMQFLQVPKAIPCRRGRSRSRPRSQDPVAVEERCYSIKANAPASRPGSPQLQVLPPPLLHKLSGLTEGAICTIHQPKRTPPIERKASYKHDKVQPVVEVKEMASADSPPSPAKDMSHSAVGISPPSPTLREKIIGTWKLESYAAYPTPESTIRRTTYPMTTKVTGLIMYTPDGYMSAQMLIPGQQSFARGEGKDPQWAEAAKRSFTYCGPYYITNEGPGKEEVLRHTFQFCNLPGWVGDVQVRTHKFEEDGQVLVLGSEEPSVINGDKRRPVLKWRRARNNANGTPPPPMPSITISGPTEV